MKMCKKILAAILVFAVMMSMCAFVHAEDPATEVLLTLHDFNSAAVGTYKSGTSANDGLNKIGLNFRSVSFGSNGITSGTVAAK